MATYSDLINQAQALMAARNFADALPLLRQAHDASQQLASIALLMAQCHLELNRIDNAEAILSTIKMVDQDAFYEQLMAQVVLKKQAAKTPELSALEAAHMLAIPSRREAMSIVVLEGGVCGCPVLFTDTCGLNALAQQEAGTMVPATAPALANALASLLDNDRYRAEAARRLQVIVQQHYLWEAQAQRYVALMNKVVVLSSPLSAGAAV